MSNKKCNVLIIGGGIMGASLAYHLSARGVTDIVVLDLEMTRSTFSSTMTNAGGVRATWWKELNIRLSLESIAFFQEHAEELDFRKLGYLWLYDNTDDWARAQQYIPLQRKTGQEIHLLGPAEIAANWPHLRTDDLAGATWSPGDGLISAYQLWQFYISRARAAGVEFRDHHYVRGMEYSDSAVTAVNALDFSGDKPHYDDDNFIKDLLISHDWSNIQGEPLVFEPETVVCASGAWSPHILEFAGLHRPLSAKRRSITTFNSQSPPMDSLHRKPGAPLDFGMIVDPAGVYFHPEGPGILAGFSPADEPAGYDFTPGSEEFFQEHIYMPLAHRFKDSETTPVLLRMTSSWSGLYSYSPDLSLIMGTVDPFGNLYEIHSDTGKGVMHSFAAGKALAERIALGRFENAEFEKFNWNRFRDLPEEEWLKESLHI